MPSLLRLDGEQHSIEPLIVAHRRAESSRIRLLKFVTLFGVGGTEKQVLKLAGKLDRSRFDLGFACLRRWGDLLGEIAPDIAVEEYPIASFYQINTLRQILKYAHELKRQRIQIVHSYNFYANVFSIPAARMAGVPCIVASIRDMGAYMTPAQSRVHKWVCRLADRILVNASAIREWLIGQGYDARKISVIRNGLDYSDYCKELKAAHLRKELGLPDTSRLVVLVSRLAPKKGVECFLEAAARIASRCNEIYFLVVGDAFISNNGVVERDIKYCEKLKQIAWRLGIGTRVFFIGQRADVPRILSEASVSVLPSFSEGLSNTLLESMAAGVPVVATDVGGTPELIEHGEHGLLVPAGDPEKLTEAVCQILDNPFLARKLAELARDRIKRHFSLDRMVHETEDMYLGLMRTKSSTMR
jgi:L-malate glycosyltransferase